MTASRYFQNLDFRILSGPQARVTCDLAILAGSAGLDTLTGDRDGDVLRYDLENLSIVDFPVTGKMFFSTPVA